MTMVATAATGSTPIAVWYLTRATGVVALVLLTVTFGLGVANVKRFKTTRIPRFVVDGVHRNASLLAVVFLGLHIITSLVDNYVPIALVNVFVPFGASYRPFWLGLGAAAVDLLLAVMVTSLLRKRVGRRVWRATHWLAYASWPIALAHSLGTGTDAGTPWMLALTAVCVLTVAVALWVRLRRPPAVPATTKPVRRPIAGEARPNRRPATFDHERPSEAVAR
jgi:methionine sulfoxide reductase heme-binding subunit